MAKGYAINEIGRGGINVSTVHTTRRAAIVNWLCVSKDMPISNAWTDAMIEQAWRSMRGSDDYCIRIEIYASQESGANVTMGEPVDFTGLDAALDELRKPVDEVRE